MKTVYLPDRSDRRLAREPARNTNPDHVFVVHPVTQIGDQNLLGGLLKPVEGHTAPDWRHLELISWRIKHAQEGLPSSLAPFRANSWPLAFPATAFTALNELSAQQSGRKAMNGAASECVGACSIRTVR